MSSTTSSVSTSTSVEAVAAAYSSAQRSYTHYSQALPSAAAIKSVPQIVLSAEEQAHYDRVVGRVLYRAVQEYATFSGRIDRSLWAPVRRNRDMAIFRSLKRSDNPRVTLMLGIGKIDGSLEDVMDGLYSDHSAELRNVMTFLKSKFIVGSIMQVSEKRTPDDPFNFAGIKWFAAKTPGGAVSYDRDLLTYERQGMTFDAEGNEVAYHLLQSVDRPEWPANTFKGLIRAHCSTCYLYKRTGNRVECFFWGEFYASGSFPQRLSDYGIAGKWLSVVNTVKCAQARKLSQLRQAVSSRTSTDSMVIAEINNCHLCDDRRSLFSVQVLCGGCQQNVCRSCSEEKKVFELDHKSGKPLTDRFCNACLNKVAKQRGSKIRWDGVDAEQPPPYFDYVFQLSKQKINKTKGKTSTRSGTLSAEESSEISSSMESVLSDESSVVDVAYLDISLKKIGLYDAAGGAGGAESEDGDDGKDVDDDGFQRRKRSHAERLSNSSYTREQLFSDLGSEASD